MVVFASVRAPQHSRCSAAHLCHIIAETGGVQVADEDGRVRGFVVERGPGLEVHPVEGKPKCIC